MPVTLFLYCSVGGIDGALPEFFAIHPFTDVLVSVGSCVGAITIVIALGLIFRTCGQS